MTNKLIIDADYQNTSKISTENGEIVTVQNPFSIDGDSVYEKDVNINDSLPGTFTGNIVDLFNSYLDLDILTDISASNPKTFTVILKRPVTSNFIGIGSANGNFSNVKILLQDQSDNIRATIDDSNNDTKFTSNLYSFTKTIFIKAVFEFYTDDAVSLSGAFIPKIQARTISSIDGYISETNTTEELLLADQVFTGIQVDTLNYGMIIVTIASDVSSATDGFKVQFRSTPTGTWRTSDEYTYSAPEHDEPISIQPVKRLMRVMYINGSSDQGVMDLQTQLKPVYVKPSSHRVADNIDGQDDAELVKANITALSTLMDPILQKFLYENITSYRGGLNVNNAWLHRKIVNETFHQHTGTTTTPSSSISEGDITVNFTSVAGFAVSSEIKITEGSTQETGLLTITDITALVVTFDRPFGNDYTTAAVIEEVTTNMASVAGTLAAPQIYEIDPPVGVVWQFTRILISIVDNLAPDDGKFGGMDALTNGVSLRATTAAGRTVVFANWKTNGDMKLDMFNVEYTDKAPAGNHGVHARWTFTTAEVVAELDGDASPIQKLEVLIQDDPTDLISLRVRGQGRVESP